MYFKNEQENQNWYLIRIKYENQVMLPYHIRHFLDQKFLQTPLYQPLEYRIIKQLRPPRLE